MRHPTLRPVPVRPYSPNRTDLVPLAAFHDGTTYRLHRVCGCGCGAIVANVYAQGHDMIAKSKGIK